MLWTYRWRMHPLVAQTKGWRAPPLLRTWITLVTFSPAVLDLMGLIRAFEWMGLTYLHLFGPSSHQQPFNSNWAKDLLLAKMMGSYWLVIFIRCPFLSSPLLAIGCFTMFQGGWLWLSSSNDVSSQDHALILCPSSDLMELASPSAGFCFELPMGTYVMKPFFTIMFMIVYPIKFLFK